MRKTQRFLLGIPQLAKDFLGLGGLLISDTQTHTKYSRIQVGVTHKFHKYKHHYFCLPFCGQHRDLVPGSDSELKAHSRLWLLSRAKL